MSQSVDIKVFSTPQCGFCQVVKSYLKSLDIDFQEIDIERDPEQARWLQENLGLNGVPVTLFNQKQFVVGWQKEAIDSQLRDLKLIN